MDNCSYWNYRYTTFPEIGSGPGSRGYAAVYKNEIIRRTIGKYKIQSILDIGCGDCCWLDDEITKVCSYLGCDIAETVVERNTAERTELSSSQFFVHDVVCGPVTVTADLVICFDVLIHQIELLIFNSALRNVLGAIGKIGLISYLSPPMGGGFPPPIPIPSNESPRARELDAELAKIVTNLPRDFPGAPTAFHGVLPEIIRDFRDDLVVEPVGRYREHTIYEISHRPAVSA